jgi:pyruvate,water dikinase
MIDANASGILYSRDPHDPEAGESLINAVWGLGPYVVAGVVPTDKYRIWQDQGDHVEYEKGGAQEVMLTSAPSGNVVDTPVPEALIDQPRLTEEQVLSLVSYGRKLEEHFGRPQDIEWVKDQKDSLYLLQSRPLRMARTQAQEGKISAGAVEGHRLLLDKGYVASKGVGTGPVYIARSEEDLSAFPEGAVLVIRHMYPEYARVLDKAAGLVADIGSNLGHLATVARESNVPALFDTEKATTVLKNGEQVTVDALYGNVYAGVVTELLKENKAQKMHEETPALKKLREVLALMTPLNLTDPRGVDFTPKGCKTLHDITRFSHEVALRAIFDASKESHFADHATRQLVGGGVPMQWWVIDLEDGIKPGKKGKKVKLEDIVSLPLLALWDGMTALPWQGPPPVDAKGFLSVMYSAATEPSIDPAVGKKFAEKNYIIISKNFCNVSTRLGFHFSTIEAYLGEVANQNYVTFAYSGGGAESARKKRRAQLISRILKLFDFRVEVRAESVFARVEGYKRSHLEDKLKVLGHIIVHTRQMDMVMHNDAMIDWYQKDLLKGLAGVVPLPEQAPS